MAGWLAGQGEADEVSYPARGGGATGLGYETLIRNVIPQAATKASRFNQFVLGESDRDRFGVCDPPPVPVDGIEKILKRGF